MNAADGMLLSIGAKGLKEWSVASDALILIMKTGMGQATKRNLYALLNHEIFESKFEGIF